MSKEILKDLESNRREIERVKAELADAEATRVAKADAIARLDAMLDEAGGNGMDLAARLVSPQFDPRKDRDLMWDKVHHGAQSFLARHFRKQIRDSVLKELDTHYSSGAALTDHERKATVLTLQTRLHELEVEDERLVVTARAQGHFVPRRPDASPEAILDAAR